MRSVEYIYQQESIPEVCVPSAAVTVMMGGVPAQWVYLLKEVYLLMGCTCPGMYPPSGTVYLPGWGCTCQGEGCSCSGCVTARGVSDPVHAGIHTTALWTEFLTNASENITFPQLGLWTVITSYTISESDLLPWHIVMLPTSGRHALLLGGLGVVDNGT